MTCISYALGEETNPRTKFGEIGQSTRRGGILCLIVISLCPSYFGSPMWYIARVLFSLKRSDSYCSCYVWFNNMISTQILLLCCWYMRILHHIFFYTLLLNYTIVAVELLPWIISYLLQLSYTCMTLDILWYYWWICVRGVPPRTRVLLMNWCEGSPPKITYVTYGWCLQSGKRNMHVSCRIPTLILLLHATWLFPKFPAICTLFATGL